MSDSIVKFIWFFLIVGTLVGVTASGVFSFKEYKLGEPVSADTAGSFYIKYLVEFEDGTIGTREKAVSEAVYWQYVNKK